MQGPAPTVMIDLDLDTSLRRRAVSALGGWDAPVRVLVTQDIRRTTEDDYDQIIIVGQDFRAAMNAGASDCLNENELDDLRTSITSRMRRGPELRLRSLGCSQVRLGTTVVNIPRKATEMLFFLAHHPGSTNHQIAQALWPQQQDPTKLRNQLHITAHRVNQSVPGTMCSQDGRYVIVREYHYDARHFLQACASSQWLSPPGEYLKGLHQGWIESVRHEIEAAYDQACARLAASPQHPSASPRGWPPPSPAAQAPTPPPAAQRP